MRLYTQNGVKLSIVTPVYNGAATLRETIESVLSQEGDFELEYFVIDGGSTDSTARIARECAARDKRLTVVSESDNGMYDAVNKGFARATGDIMAWINADDVYLPGTFQTMVKVFSSLPEVAWAKGRTVFIDQSGKRTGVAPCYVFNKSWIESGIYGRNAYFINQDSVFWRKSLWEKAGPINSNLRLAGDYDLWIKFAKYTDLWSIDFEASCFRTRAGQLSESQKAVYQREQLEIAPPVGFLYQFARAFFWAKAKLGKSSENFFLCLYPMLFWNRKKYYIALENGEPVMKPVNSYRTNER
jgi:glycosyltransferase involved in cell wall biosynthesis